MMTPDLIAFPEPHLQDCAQPAPWPDATNDPSKHGCLPRPWCLPLQRLHADGDRSVRPSPESVAIQESSMNPAAVFGSSRCLHGTLPRSGTVPAAPNRIRPVRAAET